MIDPKVLESTDEEIKPVVELLNRHGFITFESCQGGKGHWFDKPTIRFEGSEFDLIRAYQLCEIHGLNVLDGKRVYTKTNVYNEKGASIGENWDTPFNELIFVKSDRTGSIFLF